jgi:BR serine/threonine kinase
MSEGVGDYNFARTLGAGTTGKVKLATSKSDPGAPPVAVKIIKKSLFLAKPDLHRKTRREIGLMQLFDHPHLLKLVAHYESPNHIYIVLEYAANGEMFDYLVSRRRLEPPLAFAFLREIIFGLEYMHSHGICHRDLKPENILLDDFHHVKIADFGFARWMPENIAETSCGSPHYAAPEVVRGLRYDGKCADIWSCGVILFALIAGRLPFNDPAIRTLLAKVKTGRYTMPESFPSDVRDLIARMLELDPAKRITIEGIKAHGAFLMGLPEHYKLPTPLSVPTRDELDPSMVSSDLIRILRGIGYESDEEIIQELQADAKTNAKVFFEMYCERITGDAFIDMLPWEEGLPATTKPVDPGLDSSPRLFPQNGNVTLTADDPFFRRKYPEPASITSPDQPRSLAQKVEYEWAGPAGPENTFGFVDIVIPLPVLMQAIQVFLTDLQFAWYHQSDLEFLAKKKQADLVVKLEVRYVRENALELTVKPKRGDLILLETFKEEFSDFLRGLQA